MVITIPDFASGSKKYRYTSATDLGGGIIG
jgi:hypothetical protein